MSSESHPPVTELLRAAEGEGGREALLAVVYDQLRSIARQRMAGERPAHTLQATALVHEAFLKLVGNDPVPWSDRGHFYAVAAQAMRRILIDHARRRKAERRGGDRQRVPLSVVDLAVDADPDQIEALDQALTALEESDPRAAQVVRLRFFAGLDVPETAQALGLSERTVMREWAYARARLFQSIEGGSIGRGPDGE